jgi:hypothetical protein
VHSHRPLTCWYATTIMHMQPSHEENQQSNGIMYQQSLVISAVHPKYATNLCWQSAAGITPIVTIREPSTLAAFSYTPSVQYTPNTPQTCAADVISSRRPTHHDCGDYRTQHTHCISATRHQCSTPQMRHRVAHVLLTAICSRHQDPLWRR